MYKERAVKEGQEAVKEKEEKARERLAKVRRNRWANRHSAAFLVTLPSA